MPNKNKYYDLGKVVAGLVIFGLILTFPVWFSRLKAAPVPETVLTAKAKAAKECILPKNDMILEHMQILDVWRNTVVREAKRIYVTSSGKEYTMSLSNTCMDCHSNKADFCDKCHNYASVRPYCWDCHIYPEEKK